MTSTPLRHRLLPMIFAPLLALSIPLGLAAAAASITGIEKTGTTVTLRFTTVADVAYAIEGSDDLLGWLPLTGVIGSGAEMTVPLAGEGTQQRRFFRVSWTDAPQVPAGFALIPAGSFEMGQADIATPVHTVQVRAFFMGQREVTKAEWDAVRTWGLANGYTDLPAGEGKAADHPVQKVHWFAAVKWCNARSEMDLLTPCYTIAGATYKKGSSYPDCNWSANGYRLPSEAEWEKAARGGTGGQLFPWGDTISHTQANYVSNAAHDYDTSATRGYHPDFDVGSHPYSSPAGYFAAGGYGLYDMTGNVWEWCWDRNGSYPAAPQVDPHGPDTGANRIYRGGSWISPAPECRVAFRSDDTPYAANIALGFRVARSSSP